MTAFPYSSFMCLASGGVSACAPASDCVAVLVLLSIPLIMFLPLRPLFNVLCRAVRCDGAGLGAAVPPHDGLPRQRLPQQRQPRGLRTLLRIRLPEGVPRQIQRRSFQVTVSFFDLTVSF